MVDKFGTIHLFTQLELNLQLLVRALDIYSAQICRSLKSLKWIKKNNSLYFVAKPMFCLIILYYLVSFYMIRRGKRSDNSTLCCFLMWPPVNCEHLFIVCDQELSPCIQIFIFRIRIQNYLDILVHFADVSYHYSQNSILEKIAPILFLYI